jgi:hypothetical protein
MTLRGRFRHVPSFVTPKDKSQKQRRDTSQPSAHDTFHKMTSNHTRNSITLPRGGVALHRVDAQATAPSFASRLSSAELKRFLRMTNQIRDAIGEFASVTELPPEAAAELGCLSTLRSLHRRGRVTFHKLLCDAAAKGGQLEVLKVRVGPFPNPNSVCPDKTDTFRSQSVVASKRKPLPMERGDVRGGGV